MTTAACGGGGGGAKIDAKIVGGSDAAVVAADAPDPDAAPKPAGCDYAETMDPENDDFDSGAPEDSGLTLGATPFVVCGDINAGHYDDSQGLVDVDGYNFNVTADGDVLITFVDSGSGAVALDYFAVQVYDADGDEVEGDFFGDPVTGHGAVALHVLASESPYELDVAAFNSAATATTFHYKIKVAQDAPATRCVTATGSATYTEAHDGGSNTGNDVIDIQDDGMGGIDPELLTPATMPDNVQGTPVVISVGSGSNYLIDGAAAVTTPTPPYTSSLYLDRDTYQFTTGANTNQVSIRLNWTFAAEGQPGNDFDWFIFDPAGDNIQQSTTTGVSNAEFTTTALVPNTTYLLWIGQKVGSTPVAASYNATICGEDFTSL